MKRIDLSEGGPWDFGYEDGRNPSQKPRPDHWGYTPGSEERKDYITGFGDLQTKENEK
jgi:hypothetical protein